MSSEEGGKKKVELKLEPWTVTDTADTDDDLVMEFMDGYRALYQMIAALRKKGNQDPAVWARAYVRVRKFHEIVDAMKSMTYKLQEFLTLEAMPNVFDKAGVKSINLDEGLRVSISGLVRASLGPDKEAAKDWLRKHGAESLVTETVNASTLSAYARSKIDAGEDLPEDLFKVFILPSVSVTKTAK